MAEGAAAHATATRGWMATVAFGLLLAGCRAGAPVVATLPLSRTELDVRARLLAMADARRPDAPLVEAALARGNSATLRAAAALAAGQVGDRRFASRLRMLLADGDTAVAANAAFALGLLRDTSGLDVLAAAVVEGGPTGREAAWALGEIGAPARPAIEMLLHAVRPTATAPDTQALANLPRLGAALELAIGPVAPGDAVVAQLLLSAQRLRPVPLARIMPFVPARDERADTAVAGERSAWAAVYALTRVAVPGATRALLPLAASEDVAVREMLPLGLRFAATGDSLAVDALPVLDLLARDPQPRVRVGAARALATHGVKGAPSLMRLVGDADANVRIAAIQVIGATRPAPAEWERLWAADTGFMYRRSLLAAAAQAGHPMAAFAAWRADADWRRRAAVAEAPAGASWGAVREHALPLLDDADGRVRTGAIGVLAAWTDSASTAGDAMRPRMLRALDDPDFFVRASALGALAARARATEVASVLRVWARSRADSANDARIAAAAYVAAAWRADSAAFGDSLRTALQRLPVPADALERDAVQGVTPLGAWPARVGEARPHAWYVDVLVATLQPTLGGRPPVARIRTERGDITIELFGLDAPMTAHNFATLARAGYYRGTRFHRVVPNFVAQDGDPRGDGNGGPGYAIRDELNRRRYARGAVGMALSGPDTGGSQYFLTHSAQPHLDGHYTVFGRVIAGQDVLDRLVQGDRILDVDMR